jgi:hypothetical protein
MKLRWSRTAELSVPGGCTGLTRVPAADPVVAFHAVQEGVGRPVLLFVAPHVGDFDRFRATLANLPQRPGVATVYDAGRTKAGDAAPELTGFGLFSPAAPPLTWAPTGCVHLAPEVLEGAEPGVAADVPAPQQAVFTRSLPPDARRDGAGIIIRRQPADDQPFAALSRTNGRLPETYVAVPLKPGQQYCFLVGVLLRRADGGTALAQSGPVCAMPR